MDSGTARWGATGAGLALLSGLLVAEAASPASLWREQWFWFVPLFVLGLALSLFAALSFVSRYVYELPRVPTVAERRATKLTAEEHARQGRANQRAGLDEILVELGQISSQLKGELRWGKRGMLFPNNAWTKNQHLVTGETRTLLEGVYEHTHQLDLLAQAATTDEMGAEETAQRQRAKQAVDSAADVVRALRDAVND
jgi:hypothetical protein